MNLNKFILFLKLILLIFFLTSCTLRGKFENLDPNKIPELSIETKADGTGDKISFVEIPVGGTKNLYLIKRDKNATLREAIDISWQLSNNGISQLAISSSKKQAIVTGLKVGLTQLVIRNNDLKAEITINVIDAQLPVVEFGTPASSQLENVPSGNITVTLSKASTKTINVTYAVSGVGSATLNTDMALPPSSITFLPGELSKTILFTIFDDTSFEGPEDFFVELLSATNANLSSNYSHQVTIIENDPLPIPNSLVLFDPSGSPSSDSTPTIRVGGVSNGVSSGITVRLYADSLCATTALATGTATGATVDLTTSILADGTYNFYAQSFDSANNASGCSVATVSYTKDSSTPLAILSGQPTGVHNATVLNITVSGTDITHYQYKVGLASATDCSVNTGYSADILVANLITNNISGLADESIRLCVVGKNSLGTYQPYASATTATWTKDTLAPLAPNLLTLNSPATSPNTDSTPTITVAGVVIGDTVRLYSDSLCATASKASGTTSGTSINLTSSALTEGTYNFYARSTDPAGNLSPCSTATVVYNYDSVPTTLTINQKALQADPTNVLPIEWDVVFSEEIDPATFTAGDITNSGTASVIVWNIIDSGDHINFTLQATSVGLAGTLIPGVAAGLVSDPFANTNAISTFTDSTVTYDITGPTAPTITGVTGTGDSTVNNLLTTGSANNIVTLNWSDVADETTYFATIYESDGTTVKCTGKSVAQNSTSTAFTGCALTQGKAYKAQLISRDSILNETAATNNFYDFLYAPEITIADETVAEDVAAGKITFTVSLNVASDWATSVNYATANGTALNTGSFQDYATTSGTLNIAAGNTSGIVDVVVLDDAFDEPDSQAFTLNLTTPVNAIITDSSATGTITDDDDPPAISIAANLESSEGGGAFIFVANLSSISEKVATVNWTTTNGTGTTGVDFTGGTGGPVSYAAGVTTQNISIPIINNTTVCQADRNFTITLGSLTNVTAGTVSATGNITEDDFPSLQLSSTQVNEGESAQVTLSLSQVCPNQDLNLAWKVSSGSAIEGIDFATQSGNVTILKGETSLPINISTINDALSEGTETFSILAESANITTTVTGTSNTIEILDNDSGAAKVTKLAVGSTHTCALFSDGRVKCWGSRMYGQTGDSNYHIGDEPTELGDNLPAVNLGTGRTVTQIAAGRNHKCALLDNGKIKCWGTDSNVIMNTISGGLGNYKNQMGDNLAYIDLGSVPTPVQITSGFNFSCARFNNGKVKCWGSSLLGNLGQGNTLSYGVTSPRSKDGIPYVDLGTGRTAKQISSGYSHTCAWLDNDQVKCWGDNAYGRLGYEDTAHRGDNPNEMGDNLPYVNLGTGRTVKKLSVGTEHNCVILDNNVTKCWGAGTNSRTGMGTTQHIGDGINEMGDNLPAINLGTSRYAVDLYAGTNATCAKLDNGKHKCWGNNGTNNKLAATTTDVGTSLALMGDALPYLDDAIPTRTILSLALYESNTCALLDGNEVKCFGTNQNGSLGSGSASNSPTFSTAPSFDPGAGKTVLQLDSVANTTRTPCFILNNGSLKCVGRGTDGLLGLGHASTGDDPGEMGVNLKTVDLGAGVKAKDVVVGANHTCALTTTDQVKCWGEGVSGQLGSGSTLATDTPNTMGDNLPYVNLGSGRSVKKIQAGFYHNCVILDNGQVKCWGSGQAGKTGYEVTTTFGDGAGEMGDLLANVNLGTGRTAVDLYLSYDSSCARLDNNQTKCWGSGNNGRFAIGNANNIGDATGEMGNNLAVSQFGTENGQTLFMQSMANGSAHSCYLLNNNKLKCWGSGANGAIGQGSTAVLGDAVNEIGNNLSYVNLGTNLTPVKVQAGGPTTYTYGHSCVLFTNGKIKCWGASGYNNSAATGNESANEYYGDAVNEMGDYLKFVNLGTGLLVKDLFSAYDTSCVILTNDQVKCWGNGVYGKLGIETPYSMGNSVRTMGDYLPYVNLGEIAPAIYPFAILGVSGNTDTSVDSVLAHTEATVEWGAATGATEYKVTIYENDKTTVKCSEQTTVATVYSFIGCTLNNNSIYYIKVVANDGVNYLEANNSLFGFTVDQTAPGSFNILGIAAEQDILIDSTLTNGLSPMVHWQKSTDSLLYEISIYENDGVTLKCALVQKDSSQLDHYFSNCELTDGVTYKAIVTAKDAAGNSQAAANSPFNFTVSEAYQPLDFNITGVTGGLDTLVDNQLTNGSWATINWQDSAGENYYSVYIYESDGTTIKCGPTSVFKDVTTHRFTNCDLTDGSAYKARVRAINTFAALDAVNSMYDFTVGTNSSSSFLIAGIQGASIDTNSDNFLENGNLPKVVWNTSTGATSYNIAITEESGSTLCSITGIVATEYLFSNCYLMSGRTYKAKVTAVKGAVLTEAENSPFSFTLADYPLATISQPTAVEGANLVFNVGLSKTWAQTVNVKWKISAHEAIAGVDFTRTSGTLSFATGETAKSITIATINDSLAELDEKIIVSLHDPENAFLSKNSIGIGTIQDNDGTNGIAQIVAGNESTCKLDAAGVVKCWGMRSVGRLGIASKHLGDEANEMGDNLIAMNLPSGVTYSEIAVSKHAACAIRNDGGINCWGSNFNSALGVSYTGNAGDLPGELGNNTPLISFAGRTATKISAGVDYYCVILDDASLRCWGDNHAGKLGIGSTTDQFATNTPVNLGAGVTVKKIATGANTICAITGDDRLKCWGQNNSGHLGIGEASGNDRGDAADEMGDNLPYVDLGLGRTVKDISVGRDYSCAILDNDLVKCWGINNYGQLAVGNTSSKGALPIDMGDNLAYANLGTGVTVKKIVAGEYHACAILNNDRMKCWGGSNNFAQHNGRIGIPPGAFIGDTASTVGDSMPYIDVGETAGVPNTVTNLFLGADFTCYTLSGSGAYKCFGGNAYGQLGQGHTNDLGDGSYEMGDNLPSISLGSGRSVSKIPPSAFGQFQCVILNDINTSVKCWGIANYYVSPDDRYTGVISETMHPGTSLNSMTNLTPAAFGTGRTAKHISYGTWAGCAVLDDDTVKCFGFPTQSSSAFGILPGIIGINWSELGDNLPTFPLLLNSRKVLKSSVGREHICFLYDDFEVKCSGRSEYQGLEGLFANATPEAFWSTPQKVNFGTDRYAINLYTNNANTCVILDNYDVKCFGNGFTGANADGTPNTIGHTLNSMGDNLPRVDLGTGRKALELGPSSSSYCAILDNESVKCWGSNYYGANANNISGNSGIGDDPGEMGDALATVNTGGLSVMKIVGSPVGQFKCAIVNNAGVMQLRCWGRNSNGVMGTGNTTYVLTGSNVVNLGTSLTPVQVAAGESHACAVLNDGSMKCWGYNAYGQLGLGDNNSRGDNANEMGDFLPAIGF